MNDEVFLDLSILSIELPPQKLEACKSSAFWKRAFVADMPVTLKKAPQKTLVEIPVCKDHLSFCEYLENAKLNDQSKEKRDFPIPVVVDDQLAECTPQFSLRNIPKVERYYDLNRKPPFDISELPLKEATESVQIAHSAHIDPVEFIAFDSSGILSDFRIFLEEILYLCPWDQVSRGEPSIDSLWHISQSKAKLARELLDQRNSLYIYSYSGTHKIAGIEHAHGNPSEKQKQAAPKLSPFGESFGPPPE